MARRGAGRRNRYWWHSGLLALSCSLVGCAHLPPRDARQAPQPLPPELARYYAYPKQPLVATRELLDESPRSRRWLIRFPLIAPDFQPTEPVVELEWFESRASGRRPAILFSPILGGDYPLERRICLFLARHGFHVALVHRQTLKVSPDRSVDHLELLLRQGVLRIRQATDWLAQDERVDPARIGSYGISMGGIASVITAAVEPRLRCHFIALAGGSIPDIMLTSRDTLITKPLQRYLEQNHLTRDELGSMLRQAITTDPLRLAPYVDPSALLMMIALNDRTIGREQAFRLWHALREPELIVVPLGHYTSYLYLPYMKYVSLRFFKSRLAGK